jgi:RNA polymerase sigma-70 factor (ECF subfamily)
MEYEMTVSEENSSPQSEEGGDEVAGGHVTPLSLLERARANDSEAWSRLVDLYRPLVLHWCQRGGVTGADSEDLSQEVFMAAALRLARFHRDQAGDTFRGLLRGIIRNQLLMHYRRTARQPRGDGGPEVWQQMQQIPDPLADGDAEETAEISKLYSRALELVHGDFEEQTWQAFWLTVMEGRTPATLTQELGMSATSIRQAKSRVLRRIKQEVGDLLD